MSGESSIRVPGPRQPPVSAPHPARVTSGTGYGRANRVVVLAARMRPACHNAIDADEVAAILEASGINDRVATREYGHPSVFALAAAVLEHTPPRDPAAASADRTAPALPAARVIGETLTRSALYLTPLIVGYGAAQAATGAGPLATLGTLIVGWGTGQALAYLGHGRRSRRGAPSATRRLAGGFAAVAAVWLAVLALAGTTGPRAYLVAAVQLALFAVTAAALVTGRERVVLAGAVPCWLVAAAVALGATRFSVVALLASLVLLVGVAYAPALRRDVAPVSGRWRTRRDEYGNAVRHALVGTGQAALLAIVALRDASTMIPPEAVPLVCAIPLIELTVIWHQWRVNAARAVLDDPALFDRRLARVTRATLTILAVPVLIGAGIAAAVWSGAAVPGGGRSAAAVLLCGLYALCLILAAHHRTVTAAVLVWWPALLIGGGGWLAPSLGAVAPSFHDSLAWGTLLGAAVPGLAVVAHVLRDPESYR
ncbi:MAG TPA: hypothetical protein VK453_21440 [Micromonosporaceae bacterium]|nr:hypothetical protein [Micromonosporaceae bacterium]